MSALSLVSGASRRPGMRLIGHHGEMLSAIALSAVLLACFTMPLDAARRGSRARAQKTAASQATHPVAATDVRFWSQGDVTRIAIQTTGDFEFQSNKLSRPERIYYDLLGCKLQVTDEKINVISVNDGLVKQIRLAQYKLAVTRVVLDLAGEMQVAASRLQNPDRLMIEVRSGSAPPVVSTSEEPAASTVAVVTPVTENPRPSVRSGMAEKLPGAAPSPAKKKSEALAEENPADPAFPAASEEVVRLGQPAKRNRSGDSSLTRVLGLKLAKVVIDPGHGGHDTGTIGPSGLKEKDVSLDIAKRLSQLVEDRMRSTVVMTRSDDASVPLDARTKLANAEKADLFLSIHVNSSRYPAVNGSETFYLNFTRSRADLEVAARENAGSSKSIHELSDLVQKIALDDKVEESRDFASSVQQVVHQLAKQQNSRARNRGVKKAPFVVLIGAQMPSVLVEVGFMTNPAEERLMSKPEHRQKIAEAIYDGLAKYAETLSHFQVAKTSTTLD